MICLNNFFCLSVLWKRVVAMRVTHVLFGLAWWAAGLCGAAAAADYPIGPGDLVEVSVLSRPELSRAYRVRPDGLISLHIIGGVEAAGRTPAELERLLEQRLGEAFEGIASTTVEVAEYRPVFVDGHVAAPGAYAFRPGLTVAAAVALAGGRYRIASDADVTTHMRVEAEAARHAVLEARLVGVLLERARLRAERGGGPEGAASPEIEGLLDDAAARSLAETQAALRAARDARLSLRLADGEEVRGLAEAEAEAYAERRSLIGRQLHATLEELEAQRELSERGLARTQRVLDLRLAAERYRADDLEAVALEAEARQRMTQAQTRIDEASLSRDGGVLERLASLDADILLIRAEMEQARRFVRIFGGASPGKDPVAGDTVYRIRRRATDGVAVMEAGPDAVLRPGDMLEVALADAARPGREGGRE